MGRPNSLIFMHPTRSLMDKRGQQIFMPRPNSLMNALKGKRGQQIFMPRPNSMMNAIKGKRAFLHGSPNSFNFPIWSNPQFEDLDYTAMVRLPTQQQQQTFPNFQIHALPYKE